MNCKKKICDLIKILIDIASDFNMRKFIFDFKKSLQNEGEESKGHKKKFQFRKFLGVDDGDENDVEKRSLNSMLRILDNDPLDITKLAERLSKTNFVKILFDLQLYDQLELVNSSFELLHLTHSRRSHLKEMLESIQIIDDVDKKHRILQLQHIITKLNDLSDKTEKWYGFATQEAQNDTKECIDKIKELQKYIYHAEMGKRRLDSEPDAEIILDKSSHQGEDDIGEYGVREELVNVEGQKTLRHLRVYKPLIEIIIYETSARHEGDPELKKGVLKEIFTLLTQFVYNDRRNQKLIMPHIQVYLRILKDYPESGAETLIEELFRNNKSLIKQGDQVRTFTKRIIKIISELKPSSLKRSKLLLSMYSFMKIGNKVWKANQTIVLNMITLYPGENVMFLPENVKVKKQIINLLRGYNEDLEKITDGIGAQISLPPEIDYLNSLLKIMAYACEDKNAVTESKA